MTPTKDQWADIERELSSVFGYANLVCDGYQIHLKIERIAKNSIKYGVAIYVDGLIRGDWMLGKKEEALKFYREEKRYVWNAKMRAALLQISKRGVLDKADRDQYARDAKATTSLWSPYWPTAKALCRHLRTTCTAIEVVAIGAAQVAAANPGAIVTRGEAPQEAAQ